MDKYTDITINQDKVYMKVDGVETVYHAGRLKTLLNDLHRSFDAEYKETEELNKEIDALCRYIFKIQNYIEANEDDIWDLQKLYKVDTILDRW